MGPAAQCPGKVCGSLPFSSGSVGAGIQARMGQSDLSQLLTLVVDEAMCCQQLKGMDLKKHTVEEQVVSRRSLVWVEGQA